MFDIRFVTGPSVDPEGWVHANVEVTLGSFREQLQSDLTDWTIADYEVQWRDGIRRILSGEQRSCLLTSFRGGGAGYHFAWPMWSEAGTVYFHEHLILTEQLSAPFDPRAAWESIGSRVTISEDGVQVSEWQIDVADLAAWDRDRPL